jgi:acetyl-CoA/propionyl-CoA carboxylase carboxyl transferase subunit
VLLRPAANYEQSLGDLDAAVGSGIVDAVVRPRDTRRAVAAALSAAPVARGRHGNIPL